MDLTIIIILSQVVMKDVAEEFEKQLSCLTENIAKYSSNKKTSYKY